MDGRGAPKLLWGRGLNRSRLNRCRLNRSRLNRSRIHAVRSKNGRQAPNATAPRHAHTGRSRSGVFQRCAQPFPRAHDQPYLDWACSDAVATAPTDFPHDHHACASLPTHHHDERPKFGAPWRIHDRHRHAAPRRKRPRRRGRPVGIRTVVRARSHERQQWWIQGALHPPPARDRSRPPRASQRRLRRQNHRRHLTKAPPARSATWHSRFNAALDMWPTGALTPNGR
jgi:hypothetical protein